VPTPEVRADGATVFFAVGSSALDSSAAKLLEPVVKAIMTQAAGKALVSGFHSATGDLATNQELAKQRAVAVRDALKAAGLPEDRVVLDKPLQAEANLSGEDPKARKVDIRLQ
jgi:outer membrane protein OmpA-like peptidoglycan-associated protein